MILDQPEGKMIAGSLGLLRGISFRKEFPLIGVRTWVLTEHREFDMMHRREGGMLVPLGRFQHGDNHRRCTSNCSYRSKDEGPRGRWLSKASYASQKKTSWRKTKALENRAYLHAKWGYDVE